MPTNTKPAILVIEEEPDISRLLYHVLRSLTKDCDIVTLSEASTALAQTVQRYVPLVFTEYHLPGMNGFELAAKLKVAAPGACVVLTTVYEAPGLRQQALACGVDYYLAMPFEFRELEKIIHVAVG